MNLFNDPEKIRRTKTIKRCVTQLVPFVSEGEAPVYEAGTSMRSPSAVHDVFKWLATAPTEEFWCALLDGKHRLLAINRVSVGTLMSSLVHPREVFGPALRFGNVAAIICVHNHPSGDPEPSSEDLSVTRRLIEAGEMLGVPLLDHVVIGADRYVAIRERISFEGVKA